MNKIFYLFFSFLLPSFTFGMEPHSIPPYLQRVVSIAANVDEAASICNKAVERGLILPTTENADWCIHALAKKANKYELCSLARKLHSFNTTSWLEHYLKTEQGIAWASLELAAAIQAKDESLIAFLLSTKNSKLANSTYIASSPTEFVRHIEDKPRILQSLLNVGLRTDNLFEGCWALIHCAAYAGCPNITLMLLEHDADVNCLSKESVSLGDTPLIMLVKTDSQMRQSHLETAKILLEHRADPRILSDRKKPSELANLNNEGGIRGQLKTLIQNYERTQKIA